MDYEDENFGLPSWLDPGVTHRPMDADIYPVQPGTKLVLKTFEIKTTSKDDKIKLQTGKKDELGDSLEEDATTLEAAICVTKEYNKDNELCETTLTIRSPYICEALRQTVRFYGDDSFDSEPITIKGKPRVLFHYRKALLEYGNSCVGDTAIEHIEFAMQYATNVFFNDIEHFQAGVRGNETNPRIDYDRLWMIFRPGDLVVVKYGGRVRVGRLHSLSLYNTLYLEMVGSGIDKMMYRLTTFRIDAYVGSKPVNTLNAYPLRYHDNIRRLREKLVKRGEKVRSLLGRHQKTYDGFARPMDSQGDWCFGYKLQIKGRIMIDQERFFHEHGVFLETADEEDYYDDMDEQYSESKTSTLAADDDCEENALITVPEVYGYSLLDKRWVSFDVDNINEIDWDANAFQDLLMPSQQKETILALVRSHCNPNLKFEDLVSGKGKGMIFLLHGPPGLGKTLTAESIADHVRQPLLPIRCSDLSIHASDLEKKLEKILELAKRWNAIVLMDEADVFLETRRSSDLNRNALVSVFLRVLEYFEGTLFLTTNRIRAFDPAFMSRIHLALNFQPLNLEFRMQLWERFIESGGRGIYHSSAMDPNLLKELASIPSDGRQIRNAVKTAYALALDADEPLAPQHLRIAAQVITTFDTVFGQAGDGNVDGDVTDDEDSWEPSRKRPRLRIRS